MVKCEENVTFTCPCCNNHSIFTEREFFEHLGQHLKIPKTFSVYKQEIIYQAPASKDIIDRWPALFDATQDIEEFEANLDRQVLNIAIIKDQNPNTGTIVIEGAKILDGIDVPRCCALLMGLIYALNLSYPKDLKCTYKVFQKLFLELDGLKTSGKVMNLKNSIF